MATSGVTAYDRTGAQIAEHAARLCKIIGYDETLDTTAGGQEDQILESLNLWMKTDQALLQGEWRKREARLFLVPSQASYNLPGSKGADETGIGETTLDADEATSQTELSVTATSDTSKPTTVTMAATNVIGVVLDDDTIHWSTIASFSAGDTVTLDDALTGAASSGNKVYWYATTAAVPRPLKLLSARRYRAGNEIDMFNLSRDQYFSLSNKSSEGTPTEFFYDPQQGTGRIYLWPTPDTVDDVIYFTYLDELEVITANTETSNFPHEWMEYLVYGLALRLSAMYGVEVPNSVLVVYTEAKQKLDLWDSDDASVTFYAGHRHGRR